MIYHVVEKRKGKLYYLGQLIATDEESAAREASQRNPEDYYTLDEYRIGERTFLVVPDRLRAVVEFPDMASPNTNFTIELPTSRQHLARIYDQLVHDAPSSVIITVEDEAGKVIERWDDSWGGGSFVHFGGKNYPAWWFRILEVIGE